MTTPEPPHVLLTRAADKLAELADKATSAPWAHRVHNPDRDFETVADPDDNSLFGSTCCNGHCPGHINKSADAAWIAALSPAVAPHLGAWLRDTARRCESQPHLSVEGSTPRKAALAFACSVLGMEQEASDV